MPTRLINFAALLIVLFLSVYLLAIGRNILLPFVTAIVIWYLIVSVAAGLRSFTVARFKLPSWLTILAAIVIIYTILHFLFMLIGKSVYSISTDAPLYQAKLSWLIEFINRKTNLDFSADTLFKHINLTNTFTHIVFALTSLVQNLIIILIYVMFLLLETQSFRPKLQAMARNEKQYKKTLALMRNIKTDINRYLMVKTFVSFLTGFLSYIVLLSFGVERAEFWGILIFLLNYIPTIGSIVAVAFTLLVISVQFTSLMPFASIGVLLISIQIIVGNIIEPKLTGATLNLSPIVILLSLVLWGSIWGIVGMFLCVPLMTIINIILSQFENMRPIAVLLSADGNLPRE